MTMKKKGFTLIELLIVIAIIGILAVAFLPSLLGAPAKGRDAQRIATVQKINNFIVARSLTGATLDSGTCIDPDLAADISATIKANLADFGGVFPTDPSTGVCGGNGYGYIKYAAVGHKYTAAVYAQMERPENANIYCDLAAVDAVDPALSLQKPYVVNAAKTPCYIVLFQ